MQIKPIQKTVQIAAPKENVWKVLTLDHHTRAWYAFFSQGTHAVTDWQQGSKAIFKDHNGDGIWGIVIESKPFKALTIEYHGVITAGKEDSASPYAKDIKGTFETYKLEEKGNDVLLHISVDMAEEYFNDMSVAWDNALAKIKELSESQ